MTWQSTYPESMVVRLDRGLRDIESACLRALPACDERSEEQVGFMPLLGGVDLSR